MTGILPQQDIARLIENGQILGVKHDDDAGNDARTADQISKTQPLKSQLSQIQPPQIQPASLDLSLGDVAYRLRASFLPAQGQSVMEALKSVTVHEINLKDDAVLETGCVYLVPLREHLNLAKDMCAHANPKSSTGRLDVFTRVISDGCREFDVIAAGYQGPLFVEIAPRTFPILLRSGQRLVQMRFRRGDYQPLGAQMVSIDLKGSGPDDIIGYRARRHAGLVDISKINHYDIFEYWQPLYAPHGSIILDPDEFYILMSQEAVTIPPDKAAEMAPIAPEIGEFRAHYAGFFDPGFGMAKLGGAGSRAVLEVRGRDVPFLLRHGQSVARLVFEPMAAVPDRLYGTDGSHYQAQSLRLSKHFKM